MLKRRLLSIIIMFLLVLSIFSLAEVEEVSTAEKAVPASDSSSFSEACGFWCKINAFLFGSAENRAGAGWFDRSEALVGKAKSFDRYDWACTNKNECVCQNDGGCIFGVETYSKNTGLQLGSPPQSGETQLDALQKEHQQELDLASSSNLKVTEPAAAGPAAPSPPSTDTQSSSPTASATKPSKYTVSKAEIGADGTINIEGTTANGVQSKHEYKKTGDKVGDKDVYQYYFKEIKQPEWYVQEGEGLVRVIKIGTAWKYLGDDNKPTDEVTKAKKSTLIGDEVKIKINQNAVLKVIAVQEVAPNPNNGGILPPTYTEIYSSYLGDSSLGKKIKSNYFNPQTGILKDEYAFKTSVYDLAIIKGKDTVLTFKIDQNSGIVKVIEINQDDKGTVLDTSTHYLLTAGKIFAQQTDAQKEAGKATINGNTVLMKDSNTFITDKKIDFTKQQLFYEDEEDKSNGVVKSALQVDKGKMIYTDADQETQTITDTKDSQITELEGDWDKDENTFEPSGGIIYETDKTGNKGKKKYLADYDYSGDKLDTVELFDPLSGQYKGATFAKLGDYDGVTMIQNKDGTIQFEYQRETSGKYTQKEDGSWKTGDGKSVNTFLSNTKSPSERLSDTEKEYLKKSKSIEYQLNPNSPLPKLVVIQKEIQNKKIEELKNLKSVKDNLDAYNEQIKTEKKILFERLDPMMKDNYWSPDLRTASPTEIPIITQLEDLAKSSGSLNEFKSKAYPSANINGLINTQNEVNTQKLTDFYNLVHEKQEVDKQFAEINQKIETTTKQIDFKQSEISKKGNYPTISPAQQELEVLTSFSSGTLTPTQLQNPTTQDQIVKAMGYDNINGYVTEKGLTPLSQDYPFEGDVIIDNKIYDVAGELQKDQAAIQEAKQKQEEAEKQVTEDPEITKQINTQYLTSAERTTKTVLSSIYAAATSVKDYPALSKVLGISDWWKGVLKDTPLDFVANADQTFAPMLGTNWFPSAICESYYDLEPEGTAMIKTPTGTYQAIAHIEGERSAGKSPILCQRNPDQEAEQEWLCDENQVCIDNSFCYEDKDLNNEPDDEEKPLTGYFYKITWGVSAPSDETFTPFIDENGVAVSFNVVIKSGSKVEPLYNKAEDIDGPIELKNGDSDRDVILHYSPNLFDEVCIQWENAPSTSGDFTGTETIGDVCFDLVTSSVGEVNWESGGKPSSTKASDPKVSLSTGW